jgi:hypothetical protein
MAGQQFKAKKARGDIKTGGVDPFAFLPLDRRLLMKNKKQSAPIVKRFKVVDKGSRQPRHPHGHR